MNTTETNIPILSIEGNVVTFPRKPSMVLFGSIIKEARKRTGYSQGDLAAIMGVHRQTIVNWETNKRKPDHDMIPWLCAELNLTTQELYGTKDDLSDFECALIKEIRNLKPSTQRAVMAMIRSLAASELAEYDSYLYNTTMIVAAQPSAVAAGTAKTGVEFSTLAETPFFLKINDKTKNADAVVRVSGRSMEPEYHDGDIIIFQYTNSANVGDDVVVSWGNDAFVKRIDSSGTLYSLNSEYPFIYQGDGSDIRILGKVLGIADANDLPKESDTDALNELFRDELSAFYRTHNNDA